MMLFASAGSWGEVQPLLALAKHTDGQFACDERWLSSAGKYVREPWKLCNTLDHDYSIGGFFESLDMQAIFDSLYMASEQAEAIVSSFYLSPAKIVAELRGIPWIATTTSPIYFRELGAVSNARLMAVEAKLNTIRKAVGLPHSDMTLVPENTIGLYPHFLAGAEPFPVIGYPRLPALGFRPVPVTYPYCIVSTGSINPHDWIDEAIAWADANALSVLYGGVEFSRKAKNGGQHIGVPFDLSFDVDSAMRSATCAIIHGGIGTLCGAIVAGVPVIVKPFAFDQFHNARILAARGAGLWPMGRARRVDASIEPAQFTLHAFDALRSQLKVAA